ncbi:DUF3037 domain-containing protein [Niastella caeni]|uniref:DUF3037 domain-containing protein n=1 Tax=Niastella caeni TaxID=2569763 RepID=A0A4S8H8I9_9BACT|nr:DUF3037 domain-containing protein [Niastella caeni]THU30381.1 DUF3037 domain-containing protein [Niastella caeni]
MQEKYLFEYAVIRIVPKVEREEFCNVGIILYCKAQKFLQTKHTVNESRIRSLDEKADIAEIQAYLQAFEKICKGAKDGGPIAQLDMPSRFRWLTAQRSTILQTSRVHPGFCKDPQEALARLHDQLVL